jgi:protein TonB
LNRNKSYGAYNLRESYKSTTSISILGGVLFFGLAIMALTLTTEEGTATSGQKVIVIEVSDPDILVKTPPPDLKPPSGITNSIKNLEPVVVTDSLQIDSFIPTTDLIINSIKNSIVTDSVIFIEPADLIIPPETKPFIIVEEMPEFPGGERALLKYINENINYPENALINNIQGRVILKFVVNANGSVDRIEILRGIDPSLDNEAVRVASILPHFIPGRQNGIPVPVWFTLPVSFIIETR